MWETEACGIFGESEWKWTVIEELIRAWLKGGGHGLGDSIPGEAGQATNFTSITSLFFLPS